MNKKNMNKIAKFEKVSYEQFKKDIVDNEFYIDEETTLRIYESIKLPKRATTGSAGYDFFSPFNIYLAVNNDVKIPTGIRCKIDDGWVLKEYPRSGHGFKYGVHMANTVGIIDADYYYSDNEGHIFIKLVNDSVLAKDMQIDEGTAFCQGIFLPFGITVDDEVTEVRNGGMGSTDKK